MDTLYIVIPAYNEKENIKEVVCSWYQFILECNEDSRMVVVNDGSKDNTLELLHELQSEYPKLVVVDKMNGGHGSAVIAGYRYALDHGADYIFQTDSDLQTLPSEFKSFWDIREQYDAVFGYRRKRGDGLSRLIVEKIVCILLFFFFGVKIPDANCPFRIFKADSLDEYLNYLNADYMLPNIMLTTFYSFFNRKICYLPITFNARQKGNQSINLKRIFKIGIRSIKDFHSFRKVLRNDK